MRFWIVSVLLGLTMAAGCGEDGSVGPTQDPPLVLSADLQSHCYRWPEATFTRQTYAGVYTSLEPGDVAVDFGLADIGGTVHRLSDLLATKPVLLVLGSYT